MYHCRLQTRQQAESLRTGKECECEELRFRRGSLLACGVIGIACCSRMLSNCGGATSHPVPNLQRDSYTLDCWSYFFGTALAVVGAGKL